MEKQELSVREVVIHCVALTLNRAADEIPLDRPLIELGATSFDLVALVERLERAQNVTLPRWLSIPDQQSVATYVRHIEGLLHNKNARDEV